MESYLLNAKGSSVVHPALSHVTISTMCGKSRKIVVFFKRKGELPATPLHTNVKNNGVLRSSLFHVSLSYIVG